MHKHHKEKGRKLWEEPLFRSGELRIAANDNDEGGDVIRMILSWCEWVKEEMGDGQAVERGRQGRF